MNLLHHAVDTVGWVAGRATGMLKTCTIYSLRFTSGKTVRRKSSGQLANLFYLENSCQLASVNVCTIAVSIVGDTAVSYYGRPMY